MKAPQSLLFVALAAIGLPGCDSKPAGPDPAVISELQSRYVLEVEPAGAVTPLGYLASQVDDGVPDLAATPQADEPADGRVVMTGVVGGILNPFGEDVTDFPWKAGEATFYLVDGSIVEEFVAHAGEEGIDHDCPFCRREAQKHANSVVSVSFPSEAGKPIMIDSREAFGLEQGDKVVVRGEVQQVGDALMLLADGLYKAE